MLTWNTLFGPELTLTACIARILVSFCIGAILGIERRMRQHILGMRTLILICVSSTLLMELSLYVPQLNGGNGDGARIAAQVVSGIGFLGAGAILRTGLNITGLTSSGIIWASAALGLAVGAGLVVQSFIVVILLFLALVFFEIFEERFFPAEYSRQIVLEFENKRIDMNGLSDALKQHGMKVKNTEISRTMGEKNLQVTLTVKAPKEIDFFAVIDSIKPLGKLNKYRFSD